MSRGSELMSYDFTTTIGCTISILREDTILFARLIIILSNFLTLY